MRTLEAVSPSLAIADVTVSQHPYDMPAVHASGVLDYLTDPEMDALQDPRMNHFRQTVIASCVELDTDLGGELKTTDFMPKYELNGVPATFERAVYVPEVRISASDLDDLRPFSNTTEDIVVSAIDVFTRGNPEAIRLCDLRAQAGVQVDESALREKSTRNKLENRFENDIAELFVHPNGATVKGTKQLVRYSKSGKDKLRTYYMPVATDASVETDGYDVAQTIVRLADCATQSGEAQLYRQLFGKDL